MPVRGGNKAAMAGAAAALLAAAAPAAPRFETVFASRGATAPRPASTGSRSGATATGW